MTWTAALDLIRAEAGAEIAARIESRLRSDLGGMRITIPAPGAQPGHRYRNTSRFARKRLERRCRSQEARAPSNDDLPQTAEAAKSNGQMMYHTSRREGAEWLIQTDADGLDVLSADADTDTALDSIFASMEALGKLLVYADSQDVGEVALTDLGWLMVSLGEMGLQFRNASRLFEMNMRLARESAPAPDKSKAKPRAPG